jgi:PAS domain S-box-containing protein
MKTTDDGQLWFGTAHGLNRYNPKTGTFKIYTEQDGLSSATIQCIAEDLDGYLWITTANGLARFDRKLETFRTYDKSDGLHGNDFNTNACFFSPGSSDMYVGGSNGFTVFNPRRLVSNTTPPKVVITNFTAFDEPYPFDPQGKSPVSLDYQRNFISLSFAALDFHAPFKNTYRYMLEGVDRNWVQSGTSHSAKYADLAAGEYTFRVQGANSDGTWSEAEASLPIHIIPPFWLSQQFQVLGLLLLLLLFAGGLQWRFRTVRENAERLETIVSQRTAELRESNLLLEKEVEQRKRAEAELSRHAAEELQHSKERFRAVFESSAMGVVVMTLEQHIEQVNQTITKLTGYSADELACLDLWMLVVENDRKIDDDLYEELAGGQRDQYTIEKRYLRKDGSAFWARVSFSAVRGNTGKPLYTIGMLKDITEEKLAAERLTVQEAAHRRSLEKQVAKRTAELNKANEQLSEKAAQDAVSAERARLAHDLHDAVTQTLFSATLIADVIPNLWKMNRAEANRRLAELRQLTRGALAEMRALLVELRPNALTEIPLPTLLRQLTEALTGRSRINIHIDSSGEKILPADVQIGLYRIAQEALNNVVKHSKATEAMVTLRMGETIILSINDNGVGFDSSQVPADHLGIRIMRERAEAIGADFNIESRPNSGTRISVRWG